MMVHLLSQFVLRNSTTQTALFSGHVNGWPREMHSLYSLFFLTELINESAFGAFIHVSQTQQNIIAYQLGKIVNCAGRKKSLKM